MSPHTDTGALLKLAERINLAYLITLNADGVTERHLTADELGQIVASLRQAASQGSAGGERSEVQTNEPIVFWYKNYKGEEGYRRATPISIRYGTSDYHHSPQWLMLAFDTEKQAEREFAMSDMTHNLLGDQIKLGFAPAAQAAGAWRTDMENAPKDRPFLAYWHMSDIFGVLEWIDNKWIDQDGDEVMAFRHWSLFDLPERKASTVPSAHRAGPYCKMSPCPLIEPSWGPCEKCAASPSASRGTEA